jgi:hypothetical protein
LSFCSQWQNDPKRLETGGAKLVHGSGGMNLLRAA